MRPLPKVKVDTQKHLKNVLEDISQNDLRITQFIGDKAKRSDAKCYLCHASWYACDYCFAKGVKIDICSNDKVRTKLIQQKKLIGEKLRDCELDRNNPEYDSNISNLKELRDKIQASLNALKKKSNILWPYSTMHGDHRSRATISNILERIENGEELEIDEAKGIVKKSHLFDIPNFNFTYDSPAEYLHSGCLGVIKRLIQLTFAVGERRPRITKRKLSSPQLFDRLMLSIKMHREFSRRARKLDFSVLKGAELRNICIFYFPLVIECIEPEQKERNLWLNLAYMMRACLIPTEEFQQINVDVVITCCDIFYELFEALFGKKNCTINLHVFCSHLMEIRTHGPMTETSAFKFEHFYGELRRSFVPGTPSTLKQILSNVLLKRRISHHSCEKSIFLSNYQTALESNQFIYTYLRNQYQVYKITEIYDNVLTCNKVGQYPATFAETPNLNWSTVGVFRKGGICSDPVAINTSEICGKVMCVDKYLITCPTNVLLEI